MSYNICFSLALQMKGMKAYDCGFSPQNFTHTLISISITIYIVLF